MGKVKLEGDTFSRKNVAILKDILLNKDLFPNLVGLDVGVYGFGYFTLHFENAQRRSHVHWYELVTRVLPHYILKGKELSDFYTAVFLEGEDPVQILNNKVNENQRIQSSC